MNCPRSFAKRAKRYEEGEESEEEKEEEEEGRQKGGREQQEEGGEREENRGGVREEGREGEGGSEQQGSVLKEDLIVSPSEEESEDPGEGSSGRSREEVYRGSGVVSSVEDDGGGGIPCAKRERDGVSVEGTGLEEEEEEEDGNSEEEDMDQDKTPGKRKLHSEEGDGFVRVEGRKKGKKKKKQGSGAVGQEFFCPPVPSFPLGVTIEEMVVWRRMGESRSWIWRGPRSKYPGSSGGRPRPGRLGKTIVGIASQPLGSIKYVACPQLLRIKKEKEALPATSEAEPQETVAGGGSIGTPAVVEAVVAEQEDAEEMDSSPEGTVIPDTVEERKKGEWKMAKKKSKKRRSEEEGGDTGVKMAVIEISNQFGCLQGGGEESEVISESDSELASVPVLPSEEKDSVKEMTEQTTEQMESSKEEEESHIERDSKSGTTSDTDSQGSGFFLEKKERETTRTSRGFSHPYRSSQLKDGVPANPGDQEAKRGALHKEPAKGNGTRTDETGVQPDHSSEGYGFFPF
ncbi:UNVERIFIED_CONTAM: hypothetical protein FKN15_058256 [Acipenser sinensis]